MALEFAFATQLLRMAKMTSSPPSVPITSVAIPPHGSPSLAARKSVMFSGPKYTVAAYMLKT